MSEENPQPTTEPPAYGIIRKLFWIIFLGGLGFSGSMVAIWYLF